MSQSVVDSAGPPADIGSQVYIRTLGVTAVWVHGVPMHWKGNGAGRHQLRRGCGYLVGSCGLPVSWRKLKEVVGGRAGVEPARSYYMVAGLVQMLEAWGMAEALHSGDHQLTLLPHPVWSSDVDHLRALYRSAYHHQNRGNIAATVATLEQAIRHCGDKDGHRFLRELVESLPGDSHLQMQATSVSDIQRDTLKWLARLYLATDQLDRWECALVLAQHALQLPGAGVDELLLAADAADRGGLSGLARGYRDRASRDD